MIKKQIEQAMSSFKDAFGNKISWPKVESDNITVNMDGGVGGSWKVECAIDETPIDCEDLQENYTGIPAPAYLEDDPWFGPALSHLDTSGYYFPGSIKVNREVVRV